MNDEVTALRQRKIYAQRRLPEIAQDLKALDAEKKEIATKVKSGSAKDQKALNQNRSYVTMRIDVLRRERSDLLAMRRELTERLGSTR